MQESRKGSHREGGVGWAVVFAAFLTQFILYGNLKAGGVLLTNKSKDFETRLWTVGLIDAMYYGMQFALSPVPVAISDRVGVRPVVVVGGLLSWAGFVLASFSGGLLQLTVAMAVIAGAGAACVKETTFSQMALYFHERYALASFVAKSGAPVGMMVYGPVTQLLMDWYGWRGATMILGAFNFHLTACGFLVGRPVVRCGGGGFRYQKVTSGVPSSGVDDFDRGCLDGSEDGAVCCSQFISAMGLDVFKDVRFLFLTAIKLFSEFGFAGIVIYMVPNALSLGLDEYQASFTTTAWGVGNFLGLSLTAVVMHYRVLSVWIVMGIGTSLAIVCYALDPLISSFVGQIAVTAVIGASVESLFLVPLIMTRYLTTDDHVVFLYSWQNFISGLSYPVAGLVTGLLFEGGCNFKAAFFMFSGTMVMTSLCIILYFIYTKKSQNLT
ncbi:monocarboxylate transporter 12-like [Patiria miniata]|uniref:Major facilitator superfamily (MFS) profile domain-containing protein n=1 Tax=Patiria miniata TaxID=46514 RepID=A0A914B512_PATMI|nr:monocarboxylate transporter 12-like [Patiria miniata]